jgi:hypothetical protein
VEAKIMLGITSGSNQVKTLEIVWRNVSGMRRNPRRHSFECAGERALYILQEFVEDGRAGHWARISDLEVVVGGRAA